MAKIGIDLDLGTSGFRGQSMDLKSGVVPKTVIDKHIKCVIL